MVHGPQKKVAVTRGANIWKKMIEPPLPDFIEAHSWIWKAGFFASNFWRYLFQAPRRIKHYYVEAPLGNDQSTSSDSIDFILVVLLLA
jgi:hypothetical protein